MKFMVRQKGLKPADFNKAIIKKLVDYVEEKKIKLFFFPEPTHVFYDGEIMTFEAEIIESPNIQLCKYTAIPIKNKIHKITAEDIDKVFGFLKDIKEKEKNKKFDDEEFAKELGHYDLPSLKSSIKLDIINTQNKENRNESIEQLREYLLKNCKLKIPQDVLDRVTEDNYQKEVNDWITKGNKFDTIPKDGKKIVRRNTEEELKFKLIIDAIIDKEKIIAENPYLECIEKLLEWAEITD